MAGELHINRGTGQTVYALIFNGVGQVWDGVDAAFETYATAQLDNYDIALTELGTASQVYTGTFPAAIAAGTYFVLYRQRIGGTPAEGDTIFASERLEWNGSVRLSRAAWAHMDVDQLPESRTWTVEADGRVHPTVTVSVSDAGAFAADFGRILDDNETSFSTANSVVDQSGNALAVTNVRLSADKQRILFNVAASAWTAATSYTMRCVGTATDGNIYSADCPLKVRA